MPGSLELTRFRGHLTVIRERVRNAHNQAAGCGGVSSTDHRACGGREVTREFAREFGCTAQTMAGWVAQSPIDRGKPLAGKDGLTSEVRRAVFT